MEKVKGTFGTRVHDARKDADMTQEELAKKLGVSRTTVAQWERGANPTDVNTIQSISKILKRPPEFLAFGVTDVREVIKAPEEEGLSYAPEMTYDDGVENPVEVKKWAVPTDWVRDTLKANPEHLVIITAPSDIDNIQTGDKLLIDSSDRRPSPEGLFAHWDGFGVVINHISPIPGPKPTVRVYSPNSDRHYDAELANLLIVGRYKGRIAAK